MRSLTVAAAVASIALATTLLAPIEAQAARSRRKATASKTRSKARTVRSTKARRSKVKSKRRAKRARHMPAPRGAPRSLPFRPGERLTYEVTWLGVPVATATFEVGPASRHRGRPAWKFRMRANTNKYADAIYKVRDDMHSWANARMTRSVHFRKKQREGSYHRDVKLHFDHRRGRIIYQNQWRKYPPRKLYKDSYDPLALVYGFRRYKVTKPGKMEMSATDGLKTIRADVHVLGRENVTVGDVVYRCWKVQPQLKDVGGIFKRSNNAKMTVWFSDDDHRVPVKLESEVIIGSFVATLKKVEGAR